MKQFFSNTLNVDMSDADKWALLEVANYAPGGGYFNSFYTTLAGMGTGGGFPRGPTAGPTGFSSVNRSTTPIPVMGRPTTWPTIPTCCFMNTRTT